MSDFQNVEEDVLWILKRSDSKHSVNIVELIAGIDARQRMLVRYQELTSALENLISAGKVQETTSLNFCLATSEITELGFYTPITESVFEQAIQTYHKRMNKLIDKIKLGEEDFDEYQRLITIDWHVGQREIDIEIENILDDYAFQLDKELKGSTYEVFGFEMGYSPEGNTISLWIDGNENDNPSTLYETIQPSIKDFIQLHFGRLRITIHHPDKENEFHDFM